MASPNPNTAFMVSGRLAFGCTDLSTAWPHGGTGLGTAGGISLAVPSSYRRHVAEGTAATWSVQYLGGDLVLGAVIESWEDDAKAVLFPNVSDGSSQKIVEWPGSDYAPGTVVDAMALSPLVFTPISATEHPAVIVYKAMPVLDASTVLSLSSYRWLNFLTLFIGLPDATGRQGAMGLLSDLSL